MGNRGVQAFAAFAAALTGIATSAPATAQNRPELLVDVDTYDNQTVAQSLYGRPFYGTREIDELFAKCRSNGVKRATWRAMCQIASYPSALNYNIAEVTAIRSNADGRRAEGAFAAKIGVGTRDAPRLPELRRLSFGGLVQRVDNTASNAFVFCGAISSRPLSPFPVSWFGRAMRWIGWRCPTAEGAFLAAVDATDGKVLARGAEIVSETFQTQKIGFACKGPFYVGVFSYGRPDIHVFVADALSLRDAEGRERLTNGGMEASDSLLEPTGWQVSGAAFVTLNGDFRELTSALRKQCFPNGEAAFKILDRPYTEALFAKSIGDGDPLAAAGKAAERNGVALYAWLDPFDDGRRALPPVQAWSSRFLEEHPEYRAVDRDGRTRWGLLCFGYPEVRRYKTAVVEELLSRKGVAGVALKTHYQHNTIWDGKGHDYSRYLYNEIVLEAYRGRWGRPANGVYDTFRLRMIYGDYVLQWLREIRPLFKKTGKRLCLFQAPASMLDTSCGGWVVPPEQIVAEKLCDDFLIEPRIHGDSVETFEANERMRRLVALCQQNSIGVGFDFWLPGIPDTVKSADRGAFMRDQLSTLAREGFDFMGVYEEMCLIRPDLWPVLGDVSRTIQSIPPGAFQKRTEVPSQIRNVLSVFEGGRACSLTTETGASPVTELIDGDDSNPSSVVFEKWPVVIEATPQSPSQMNTVVLKGGNLSWKNQCAPEDFAIEARVDGHWRLLAMMKNAATDNGHNNARPVVCRFEPVRVEKMRVTFTRGSDAGKRFLVVREIEAYLK
jgi:hypothetical protein